MTDPRQGSLWASRRRRVVLMGGDEGNRTPNPRLAKSTEGWIGAVGCERERRLTSAFIVGPCRAVLADSGRFADHLRTVCGLGPPQQSPRTLPRRRHPPPRPQEPLRLRRPPET